MHLLATSGLVDDVARGAVVGVRSAARPRLLRITALVFHDPRRRLEELEVSDELIKRFECITYALGSFLVWTAIKLAFSDEEADPEKGWTLRLSRKLSADLEGELRREILCARGRPVCASRRCSWC